jgi:bifunctional DNA-binding transcriptional regulator/antitoxin component of YhaV-PrlF toxin-antitoxin module
MDKYTLQIGLKGRVILPVSLRKQANIGEGDKVVCTISRDGIIQMKKLKDAADRCKGLLKDSVSGVSMAEELLDDRRREFKEDE